MIRIITDSTCDLERSEWKALDLTVLSLTINFGARVFKDGRDLSHADFYDMLAKAQKLPTTSQVNPGEFEDVFTKYVEQGDEIVGIFIASDLSGTMQSALIAANAVDPEKIFIVDSRSASFGMALLIREAARMRDTGKYTAAEIARTVQKLALRLRIYAVVDTLKYLKMGGRISGGAAAIGGLLGILPVVEVYNGKVQSIDKTRGEKGGKKALLQLFQKYEPDFEYGVAFGHSNVPDRMKAYMDYFRPHIPVTMRSIHTSGIGSVIGTHTGPGVVGVAFISKEKN
ncbi:MAG: DegV family protein [Oscillospiraceae bacterium]